MSINYEQHPQAMLSFLLEGATYQSELSETAPKPPLRVDGAMLVFHRNKTKIVHTEFETDVVVADSESIARTILNLFAADKDGEQLFTHAHQPNRSVKNERL